MAQIVTLYKKDTQKGTLLLNCVDQCWWQVSLKEKVWSSTKYYGQWRLLHDTHSNALGKELLQGNTSSFTIKVHRVFQIRRIVGMSISSDVPCYHFSMSFWFSRPEVFKPFLSLYPLEEICLCVYVRTYNSLKIADLHPVLSMCVSVYFFLR